MIERGHMNEEKDTDGTTDAHEGDHTPADGAGTEGEGGKPDTRPGDRLATIRRTLWWIGLALQLPFALTLIHFDTPYLILERILCAIPPRLASDPSSIVGIPALETEWCREFLALVLGRSLLGYSWSNEISCGQPIKPWKRNPSCTHLRRNHHHHRIDGHRYYRTLPRHSGLLEVSPYLAEEFQIESTTANVWADDTSAHT